MLKGINFQKISRDFCANVLTKIFVLKLFVVWQACTLKLILKRFRVRFFFCFQSHWKGQRNIVRNGVPCFSAELLNPENTIYFMHWHCFSISRSNLTKSGFTIQSIQLPCLKIKGKFLKGSFIGSYNCEFSIRSVLVLNEALFTVVVPCFHVVYSVTESHFSLFSWLFAFFFIFGRFCRMKNIPRRISLKHYS